MKRIRWFLLMAGCGGAGAGVVFGEMPRVSGAEGFGPIPDGLESHAYRIYRGKVLA